MVEFAQKRYETKDAEYLIQVSQDLSMARTLADVQVIASKAAREICGADGATLVLRAEDLCSYVEEDSISPLWKGRKFPLDQCVSGWSILNRQAVVIEDIYADARVPQDAYRPTFVKSLAMVPIRENDPLGAIGNYWAHQYRVPASGLARLRSLGNLVGIAIENVQLLAKLERTNDYLRDSLRARDEFLSIASHELRTPVSSLSLQIQSLDRRLRDSGDERLKAGVDLSIRQVGNLGRLIENLLDVSKIRLQKIDLSPSPGDFSAIVRDGVEQCLPQLSGLAERIELRLADGIRGDWDSVRVRQIVTNLVSNACKYAPEGPVRVTTDKAHGLATLVVADAGPGIASEDQARIFERFERGRNDNHLGGMGLGLFITRRVVEAHRGRIFLASELGRGARFTVELPC